MIDIVEEFETVHESINYIKRTQVDIIFLDVHLRDGKGMEILEKIDSSGHKIIFTTAFDDYSLEAFKHKSFGYLMKPLNPLDFKEIVERVIKVLDAKSVKLTTSKKIKIRTSTGTIWVNLSQIVRCQAQNNYTEIFLENSSMRYTLTKTLKMVELEVLNSDIFFRCHQSHLINLNYLSNTEIKRNCLTMDDKSEIPISRAKRILFEKEIVASRSKTG